MKGTTYSSRMMEPPDRSRTLIQNRRLLSSQITREAIVDFSKTSLISTLSWSDVTPAVRSIVVVVVTASPDTAKSQFFSISSTMNLRPLPIWYFSVIILVIASWKSVSNDWNRMSQLPSWAVVDEPRIEITTQRMLNKIVGDIMLGGSAWIDLDNECCCQHETCGQ